MSDRLVSSVSSPDDDRFDRLFRPESFDEYIGQKKHVDNLRVFVEATKSRGIRPNCPGRLSHERVEEEALGAGEGQVAGLR